MSDALSMFMNNLMENSGVPELHINIISDNARKVMTPGATRRRRIPRRSRSTPLNHMSRWESASSFDFNSMNPSAGTSPVRGNNPKSKSRWESIPTKRISNGPARPSRCPSGGLTEDDLANDISNNNSDKNVKSATSRVRPRNPNAFGKFGNELVVVSSSALPKSLRSLPY